MRLTHRPLPTTFEGCVEVVTQLNEGLGQQLAGSGIERVLQAYCRGPRADELRKWATASFIVPSVQARAPHPMGDFLPSRARDCLP